MKSVSNVIFPVGSLALSILHSTLAAEDLAAVNEVDASASETKLVAATRANSEAWLGVSGDPLPDILQAHLGVERGLLVHYVNPDSPAERAGIKPHDVLLAVGDRIVGSQLTLKESLLDHQPGDEIELSLFSGGEKTRVNVNLAQRPAELVNSKPQAERQWIESRKGSADGQIQRIGGLNGQLSQIDSSHQKIIESMLNDRSRGFNLHQQLDEQFEQMRKQMMQSGSDPNGLQLNFNNLRSSSNSSRSSVMTMADNNGSVTMKTGDGGTQVTVKDNAGAVLFEGPYHTDEEKAAVDPEIRKRIDSQSFKMGGGSMSLRSMFGR